MTLAAAGVLAQTQEPAPEGLQAGKWIVSPYFGTAYTFEDNVFRTTFAPVDDSLATQTLGVGAYLPVRNSMLTLNGEFGYSDYQRTALDRNESVSVSAEFVMNLGTNDTVGITETFVNDFVSVAAQDADAPVTVGGQGELVFTGEPFRRNEIRVDWTHRTKYGELDVGIRRDDLNYSNREATVNLIEYRGYETTLEYRHKLPQRKVLTFYASSRRFDNFRADVDFDPTNGNEVPLGAAFRKEIFDQLQVGAVGAIGSKQEFFVRAGVGRFDFEDTGVAPFETSPFVGITIAGLWSWRFGAESTLTVRGNRRPIASNFDTYFVSNDLQVDVDYRFGRRAYTGLRSNVGLNDYEDPTNIAVTQPDGTFLDCSTFAREDRRYRVEPYARFYVHDRVAFDVAVQYENRTSNCEVVSFDYTTASANLRFGWF